METDSEKIYDLELAQQLYRKYYAACFWHMKPDLAVKSVDVPALIKGMRTFGGRSGWFDAAKLAETAVEGPICQ